MSDGEEGEKSAGEFSRLGRFEPKSDGGGFGGILLFIYLFFGNATRLVGF